MEIIFCPNVAKLIKKKQKKKPADFNRLQFSATQKQRNTTFRRTIRILRMGELEP